MDKAVIFGVFDFVSFHVCKALLDRGIEVKGINVDDRTPFLDEKRLEIGRNANFEELSLTEPSNLFIQDDPKETIFFSLYDIYMQSNESILQKETIISPIISYLTRKKEHSEKIVFLLPSQLLTESMDPSPIMILNHFLAKIYEINKNIQRVYLPTVYGPWQPETFIYQQTILRKMNRNGEFKGMREETGDALFIDDTVEALLEIIEKKNFDHFLLESGRENQWDMCAAFLDIDTSLSKSREKMVVEDNINKLTVKTAVTISDSLIQQINHAKRINR